MRALRILSLVSLLAFAGASSALAQRVTQPGDYDVKVCIAPGFLPQGGAELPADLQNVGPDVYSGTLSVVQRNDGTYTLTFRGEREDGARLQVSAQFESDWGGFLLGQLPVGSNPVDDCVTGIDVANLISARVNGIGTIDGVAHRLLAHIGPGGSFDRYSIKRAPGPFRSE